MSYDSKGRESEVQEFLIRGRIYGGYSGACLLRKALILENSQGSNILGCFHRRPGADAYFQAARDENRPIGIRG